MTIMHPIVLVMLTIFFFSQSSTSIMPNFKVLVRLMVFEQADHIFWDTQRGTLHSESMPKLIRTGYVHSNAKETVEQVVRRAVYLFCKQLLDAQYGPEYKIAAIFTDNDLNMQIHRGMTSEPNSEYTAILSIKDEKNLNIF